MRPRRALMVESLPASAAERARGLALLGPEAHSTTLAIRSVGVPPWDLVLLETSVHATWAVAVGWPDSASKASSSWSDAPSGKAPRPTSPQRMTAALHDETLPTV